MKATLLVFSGRKNPTWLLSNDEGKRLYDQLCQIPGTMETWGHNDYLGYCGIEILLDATEKMRVYNSIVEVVSHDEVRRFIDINRELEMWLFQTSRDRIDDGVYNQLLLSEFRF